MASTTRRSAVIRVHIGSLSVCNLIYINKKYNSKKKIIVF